MTDAVLVTGANALVRTIQVALEQLPFWWLGIAAAALLGAMIPPARLRRWFGEGSRVPFLYGWAWGMLLPLGAVSLLPLGRLLWRAGAPRGAVIALICTGGSFDPAAAAYFATLATLPAVWLAALLGASLLGATAVGLGATRPVPAPPVDDFAAAREAVPAPEALGRLRAALSGLSAEALGPAAREFGWMLLGAAVVGAALPIDHFSRQMSWRNPFAPLWMVPAALPGALDACTAIMLSGEMVEHGNSFGAMVGLFCLGAGTNLATFAWLRARLGGRATLRIAGTLVGVLLTYGGIVGGIGYRPEHEEAHTHAFDRLGQRYRPGTTAVDRSTIAGDLDAAVESHGQSAAVAAGLFGLLAVVGATLRQRGPRTADGTEPPADPWNRPLSGTGAILAGAATAVPIVLCGLWIVYPAPRDQFEELRIARTEAVGAIRIEAPDAPQLLARYRDEMGKLSWGVRLRGGVLTHDQAEALAAWRAAAERIDDVLRAGRSAAARDQVLPLLDSHERCRRAFLDP